MAECAPAACACEPAGGHGGGSHEGAGLARARLAPPPLRPVPILIGGVGPRRTLRLVARHATMWHAMFPERPDELLPAVEALRRWCGEVGRDPGDIEWWVGVEPYDVDRFLEHDAEVYLDVGFTGFTLGFNGPDWSVSRGREWLSWRDARNPAPTATRVTPP